MNVNEEWAGINRMPRIPDIIEGFDYPKPVANLIQKVDAAYHSWAEADTAVSVAEDELEQARAEDEKSFAESILNGTDDPGDVHTPIAMRNLKGAQILAEARRRDVNAIGRVLSECIRENAKEITLTAIEGVRFGLAEQERLMLEAGKLANDAVTARNRGLAGLRSVANYTRGIYAFDSQFPVTGFASFPSTREERVVKIVDDLEMLISTGALFGEVEESA